MGTFYTAGHTELANFLTSLGLTFHSREDDENVMYFTNHANGKQVKVQKRSNLVSLLDERGETIESSSSFTDNQLVKFLD